MNVTMIPEDEKPVPALRVEPPAAPVRVEVPAGPKPGGAEAGQIRAAPAITVNVAGRQLLSV